MCPLKHENFENEVEVEVFSLLVSFSIVSVVRFHHMVPSFCLSNNLTPLPPKMQPKYDPMGTGWPQI